MLRFLLIAITLLSTVFASQVSQVVVLGNEHTREHIITRELQHPIPSEFDPEFADQDRNRLYNLGIFSTVEITQRGSDYLIILIEAFRVIPIPITRYDEAKGSDGWSFGGIMAFMNFRGLDERLQIGGTVGNIKSYFFSFSDPWVYGVHGSLSVEIRNQYNEHPVYAYGLRQKSFFAGTGVYRDYSHKLNLRIGHVKRSLEISTDTTRLVLPIHLNSYHHLEVQAGYIYDTRDIYWDPTHGILAGLNWHSGFGLHGSHDFHSLGVNLNLYRELLRLPLDPVLSLKTFAFFQFPNTQPVFRRVYLGGESYVRGYSPVPWDNPSQASDRIEVTHLIYHTLEYQMTLSKKRDLDRIELGIDFLIFTDYGYGSDELKDLKFNKGILGYGFGLRMFASGFGVLSLDFGFNPYQSKGRFHLRSLD